MKILRSLGFFVSTLVVYLGIPLVGWGLGDLRGFFSVGPRKGYALVVLALALVIAWQAFDSPEGIRGDRGREEKLVTRQSIVRVAVILLLYAGLLFVPFADRRDIRYAGKQPRGPLDRGWFLWYWNWIGILVRCCVREAV
jgi:hypothetical protein